MIGLYWPVVTLSAWFGGSENGGSLSLDRELVNCSHTDWTFSLRNPGRDVLLFIFFKCILFHYGRVKLYNDNPKDSAMWPEIVGRPYIKNIDAVCWIRQPWKEARLHIGCTDLGLSSGLSHVDGPYHETRPKGPWILLQLPSDSYVWYAAGKQLEASLLI